MTETFRAVEPLTGEMSMNPKLQSELRRALFEWRDAGGDVDAIVNAIQEMIYDALPPVKEPCKHVHVLPPSRWDPKSMCMDCGATLP